MSNALITQFVYQLKILVNHFVIQKSIVIPPQILNQFAAPMALLIEMYAPCVSVLMRGVKHRNQRIKVVVVSLICFLSIDNSFFSWIKQKINVEQTYVNHMNVVYILFNLVQFVFIVNILHDSLLIVVNVVRIYRLVVMMDIYIKIIVRYYVDNAKKIVILI